MEPLGAEVRIDAAGNLRGFYAGADSNAPRLLVGSHLDTVPNAGAYDGSLGVVLAIALLTAAIVYAVTARVAGRRAGLAALVFFLLARFTFLYTTYCQYEIAQAISTHNMTRNLPCWMR